MFEAGKYLEGPEGILDHINPIVNFADDGARYIPFLRESKTNEWQMVSSEGLVRGRWGKFLEKKIIPIYF